MTRGARKAWAGVWSSGGVFSCLWWGLNVTSVCCCGCVDDLYLRYAVDTVALEQAFLYVLRLSPVSCCSIIFLVFINLISWAPITGPLKGVAPGNST